MPGVPTMPTPKQPMSLLIARLVSTPTRSRTATGGYKLNFDDADIKDVLQAVLGGVLHVSYTLAPNITGKITISSAALRTVQNCCRLWRACSPCRADDDADVDWLPHRTRSLGHRRHRRQRQRAGFGITVVPLQYSSASSVLKLVGGFLSDADGVRIDAARNTIIVRAPAPRREEIVRAIKNFDADWMHTQSVSVVELRRSSPDDVIGELNRIFDIDKGHRGRSRQHPVQGDQAAALGHGDLAQLATGPPRHGLDPAARPSRRLGHAGHLRVSAPISRGTGAGADW